MPPTSTAQKPSAVSASSIHPRHADLSNGDIAFNTNCRSTPTTTLSPISLHQTQSISSSTSIHTTHNAAITSTATFMWVPQPSASHTREHNRRAKLNQLSHQTPISAEILALHRHHHRLLHHPLIHPSRSTNTFTSPTGNPPSIGLSSPSTLSSKQMDGSLLDTVLISGHGYSQSLQALPPPPRTTSHHQTTSSPHISQTSMHIQYSVT